MTAECGALDSSICAQLVTDKRLVVNDKGCANYCSVIGVEDLSVGDLIYCSNDQIDQTDYSFSFSYSFDNSQLQAEYSWSWSYEYSSNQCGVRLPKKELRKGDYPKLCDSNFDCMLEDGTEAACSCSLDGNSYCVPDFNSEEYNDFWNECDDDDLDGEESTYWHAVMSTYPLYLNAVDCAMETFDEFKVISNYDGDGGVTLCICLLSFIFSS